jgi:hypothetical protein
MEPPREPGPPWLPASRSEPPPPVPIPPGPPPGGAPPGPGAQPPRPRFDWRRLTRSPRATVSLAVLAAALLLWPFAGFSWIPWLIGIGALIVLRLLRLDGPLRGWDIPLACLAVVIGLMLSTSPWAWALAGSIGVLFAGLVQLPRWRLAAVGAVLCVVSGIGFGLSVHQDRLALEEGQARAGDLSRAGIAERSEEILPAFVRALSQPVPDPQPICRLLGGEAQAQLAAASGRASCAEAVGVLHGRVRSIPASSAEDPPKPQVTAGSTDLLIDACDTRWAAAAGPTLGRIHLQLVSPTQRTYDVRSFSAC